MRKNKIGIMGGTFDPIHYGHLVTAEVARHQFQLDQVIFVPSGNPPHKQGQNVTMADERLMLTLLATVSNPNFVVSDWEVEREELSYTWETIKAFNEIYGEDFEFYFITGADAILEIATWKEVNELAKMCNFIAATRPGYKLEHFHKCTDLPASIVEKVHFIEVPALAISSSDIRKRVQDGLPIKYLLPENVEMYIKKHRLYENV